jgi:biotin-dependent carboxylase-like uncharacterized protein
LVNRIHVLAPGFLTTVQDLGRYGWAHLGISASGAADALALRAGNLLVGNTENAAALEMTLTGGEFAFDEPAVVCLTGADLGGGLPRWEAFEVAAGGTLRCGAARGGARGYLCVRGGIHVPAVLGSASTHLLTGTGGFEGRALRAGDVLDVGKASVRQPRAGAAVPPIAQNGALRVTPGPQAGAALEPFCQAAWRVAEESNRMGLRLHGPPLAAPAGGMLTEGVPLGAVQLPPGGQPIILFVEHQTTGGYPKIANVVSADFWRVGQLRPRDEIAFACVSFETARELLRDQERWLYSLL